MEQTKLKTPELLIWSSTSANNIPRQLEMNYGYWGNRRTMDAVSEQPGTHCRGSGLQISKKMPQQEKEVNRPRLSISKQPVLQDNRCWQPHIKAKLHTYRLVSIIFDMQIMLFISVTGNTTLTVFEDTHEYMSCPILKTALLWSANLRSLPVLPWWNQ